MAVYSCNPVMLLCRITTWVWKKIVFQYSHNQEGLIRTQRTRLPILKPISSSKNQVTAKGNLKTLTYFTFIRNASESSRNFEMRYSSHYKRNLILWDDQIHPSPSFTRSQGAHKNGWILFRQLFSNQVEQALKNFIFQQTPGRQTNRRGCWPIDSREFLDSTLSCRQLG